MPEHRLRSTSDRGDPARFLVAASDWPTVGDLGGVGSVLIAPQWVLTAAHVVEGLEDAPFADWDVGFGGRQYRFDKIVIRPGRVKGAADSDYDLALLHLTEPVAGITPSPLYAGSDESGQVAILLGRGAFGTGLTPPDQRVRDGALRRVTNKIQASFERSIVFQFDAPPGGTEDEGLAAQGDSGAPAFLEREGELYVAGIGSFNAGEEDNYSQYGTLDAYARVSAHREWIEAIIAAGPASSVGVWSATVRTKSARDLPASGLGRIAAALVTSLGNDRKLGDWFAAHGNPSSRAPAERAGSVRQLVGAGDWTPLGYRTLGDGRLALAARRADGGLCKVFVLTAGEGEKLSRLQLRDYDCAVA